MKSFAQGCAAAGLLGLAAADASAASITEQNVGDGASNGADTRAAGTNLGILWAAWLVEFERPQFDAILGPDGEAQPWGAALSTAIAGAPGQYAPFSGSFSTLAGNGGAGGIDFARRHRGGPGTPGPEEFETPASWANHPGRRDHNVVNPIPEPSSQLLFAAGATLVALSAATFSGTRKRS